jgi:glycine hydroxymethyltransferase
MAFVNSGTSATRAEISRLLGEHTSYRAAALNLIASENVLSPAVAAALVGDLEGRYADYMGSDLTARKYRGGRYIVELEQLCSRLACGLFGAEACELRAISGHVAGSAALLGLCSPGDVVMELGSDGGGHRLAAKLAEARLVELEVEFLPFDADAFNIAIEPTVERIHARRPRLVILGSSSFLHPHPVAAIAETCHEVGALLAYDASHVLGLIAGGRFQSPLAEGADLVFGSTHKTFCGPQGGIVLGSAEMVEQVAAGLYPPLVTNHHAFRIPALAMALCEHLEFGRAYADAVIANANAFLVALADEGISVVGSSTDSHTVLVALPGGSGSTSALALEATGIICNQTRLPAELGVEGLRFGLQELTRRGGSSDNAGAAGRLVAAALRGGSVHARVRELAARLSGIAYTWSAS